MSEPSIGQGELSLARLKTYLRYDPGTGLFTWLVARNGSMRVGDIAGTFDAAGYRVIRFDFKLYRACRLAWFYMKGEWPQGQIDHKNLDRSDDRWDNLRSATNGQNNMNRGARSDSTSGLKGAHWSARDRRWFSRITANGVTKDLGGFKSAEAAHEAYVAASKVLHGEFSRGKS